MNRPGATSITQLSTPAVPSLGGPPPSWRLSSCLPALGSLQLPRGRCWCVTPAPSGPGCSAPSRVRRGLSQHPPLRLLASLPPHVSPSPSGPAGLLPGRLLALGVRLGPPGGPRTLRGDRGRVSVRALASSELHLQVCPEGVFWAPLKWGTCQPLDGVTPGAGCGPQGAVTGRGDGLSSSLGVGHWRPREADGSEGLG